MADTVEQLSRALAGRYTIQRELGRGGMATVFLAEDLKHHRRVAIKVLQPELTALLGADRFLREIEIAAGLNHPHILPLYDSGAAEGLLFYVMPYAEGESLRQRLERERQLPLRDALRIARETADALDHAHRRGVVHRDIKPENLLLVDQHAVVADFGIARAILAAGDEKLTATGVVIGTPAYMSPEQTLGSQELDARSDQYSLGCVLYELLAGQPPFTGPTAASLAHQHLNLKPRPVTELRATVPESVARALAKVLSKTPADRFGTAAEFAAAIAEDAGMAPEPRFDTGARTVDVLPPGPDGRAAKTAERRRRVLWLAAAGVLVLVAVAAWQRWGPFARWLGGSGSEFAAKKEWILVAEFEGPADDSSMARAVRDMVGASLDQSAIVATVPDDQIRLALEMAGKPRGTRVDAALARELAVRRAIRAVVEGRVSRLGGGYSVVVRAVDAASGKVVAAVSDAASSDDKLIPTVGRVVRRLRDELGERREDLRATREFLVEVMTPSYEAYKRVLRARELIFGGDNRGAIAMAQSALSLDPDCAVAWGVKGFAFGNLGEPDSALAAFDEALRRKDRLDEIDRFMHLSGWEGQRGNLKAAMATLDQALQHDPAFGPAHNNQSSYLLQLGRPEESLASSRRAAEVSPFGPTQVTLGNQFEALLWLGRLDEARAVARQLKGDLARVAPEWIALAAGDWAAAESLGKAQERLPDAAASNEAGRFLAVTHAARGSVRAAVRSLERYQRARAEERRQLEVEDSKRVRLLVDLVSGHLRTIPDDVASRDTTTLALVTQGLWEAAAGDTSRARSLLARVRSRSMIEQRRQGSNPILIEAWIAARAGRPSETVDLLGPTALQGDDAGSVLLHSNRVLKRWLVAEAYESLSRPDSAVAYFDLAMSPIGSSDALKEARIAYSYAHRRLVLLYARMGRPEDARKHWETFSKTFTRPDPEVAPLIEEARAALAVAEATGRSARR